MALKDLLLEELAAESARTRKTLERVPAAQADFKPRDKSMALGKLAAHVAQLGGFGVVMLTQPELNFATAGFKPLQFESPAQLVEASAAGTAAVRAAIEKMNEAAWSEPWRLRADDKVFFTGSRFVAYRAMYVNHIVHHRAQLGVYLRLLDLPVPSIYGPSADEPV